ncbi:hypothetical protein CLV99_0462 [Sphingobacterium yanglingense]|uniref:CHAP domain-containing protein n=2 Tax=Sphingobacterium yanglingense TaxID=1437280 RepID=A0A4R6WKX4_9SPHI|nr:hypothetical protein CLV99_0462 [Sphingobacterium yanglingense]
MATMYSLFFGLLFTVICSVKGDGSGVLNMFKTSLENGFYSLYQGRDFHFFLDEKTKQKNQGLVAHPKFNLCPLKIKTGTKWSSAKLNSPDLSGSNSLIFLTRSPFKFLTVSQPRPFYSVIASTPLQSDLMSPVKPSLRAHRRYILTIPMGGTAVRSECSSDKAWTLGRYQVSRPSGMEDRINIIKIASKELGTHEATGNNDGLRVEQYLRYTNLGKGYEWCSAFVSWCYGQAGFAVPRNPWSPALFPKARQIDKVKAMQADVFGIYGIKAKRINHVGLVKEKQGQYLVTIEGNSNDRVESRRRHLRTIYTIADWVN